MTVWLLDIVKIIYIIKQLILLILVTGVGQEREGRLETTRPRRWMLPSIPHGMPTRRLMKAYEPSDFCKQEVVAPLGPFFVGDCKTTYCEVKQSQECK